MVLVETSFPRGGTVQPAQKDEKIIFGARQERKKLKKIKKPEDDETKNINTKIEAISADLLNYKTIQEGMILFGTVKYVDSINLKISLPGRLVGKVLASSVSDSYNKILKEFIASSEKVENFKTLDNMYKVGQTVYTKVMEIKKNDAKNYTEIELSLKPIDVHTTLYHENFRKGMLFNGAIEEILEHGYIIETGVKNLRCFLPKDNTGIYTSKDFGIGELVFLKVEDLKQNKNASTAVCKMIFDEKKRKIKDLIEPKFDYLMPSTLVNFSVTKILKDGLQGTIMNGLFTGYVNEHQLVKTFSIPSDYKVNATILAKILYVMPLTKLVNLSLRINPNEEELYKKGTIIDNAIVHHHDTRDIILLLDNGQKAIISFKLLKSNFAGNFDQDDILAKYRKNSVHKIRIVDYNLVDNYYICSDNIPVLNEKYFTLDNCEPGEFVTASVQGKDRNNGALYMKLGNCNGIMEKIFQATQTGVSLSDNKKLKCRIMAVNTEKNCVYFTNRPEYMIKDAEILKTIKKAKENRVFLGTIVKCTERFFIVKFFNNIKGILYKTRVTGYMSSELDSFNEGQTMSFRIITKKGGKLLLGFVDDAYKIGEICEATISHSLENALEVSVETTKNQITKGVIPIRLLSEFPDLIRPQMNSFNIGQKIEVACIVKTIFSLRDIDYFKTAPIRNFKSLETGDILRGFIKNVEDEMVELLLPVRNFNKLLRIHSKMFFIKLTSNPNVSVYPDQIVYVKVLSKESNTKTLTVSAKLTDVWDGDFKFTGEYFEKYLMELKQIRKSYKARSHPLEKFTIGDVVSANFVTKIKDTGDVYIEFSNKVQGIIKSNFLVKDSRTFKEGDAIEVIILWIDYDNELVYCSNQKSDIEKISKDKKLPKNLIQKSGIMGKVLLKLDNVILCSLKKGKNPLIYVPTRLHYNDFENTSTNEIKENDFCRLNFIHEKYPIAIFESTEKIWKTLKTHKRKMEIQDEIQSKKAKLMNSEPRILLVKQNATKLVDENSEDEFTILSYPLVKIGKKRKLETKNKESKEKLTKTVENGAKQNSSAESEHSSIENEEFESDSEYAENDTKPNRNSDDSDQDEVKENLTDDDDSEPEELNSDQEREKQKKFAEEYKKFTIEAAREDKKDRSQPVNPVLPGASNFWSTNLENLKSDKPDSSSEEDDEDDTENQENKKKKRTTASERFQAEKLEEARLRDIENKYADPNTIPETSDQFDRLVLSDPNNSKNWINYMVFHLQATEIDRARTIARKALKAISFREEQELINIWIALLNLELRYGTKDSFSDILKECLLSNDPYKVYIRVLEILTDAKKIQELTDIIGTVTKKFKDKPDIWKKAASAYFELEIKDKAQQLLHRALAVLPERDHINTIVSFANLNYKYGDSETAHTLLEQIVTSYPKRVDVWCQYVDMLIKDQQIESARRTLERAVVQKIPIKKMRTLFKKYLEFEQKHGTEDSVLKVKELATNYVKNDL